jgi:hypothetical protein
METSLIAKLGLNSSEFHQKIGNAEKGLKQFSGGVGDIAKVFTAGGTLTAVTSFFRTIISHAAESGDALDANVQAVGRFGESFENAKSGVMDFGVTALGTLNRFGESIGTTIKGIGAFFSGSRAEFDAAEDALAATADSAARVAANLAEARKHATEFNAITSALAKLDEKREQIAFKNLTTQERINTLANQIADAEERAADATLPAIERRRALLEQRTAELALVEEKAKREIDQAKQIDAWQKQINAEVAAAKKEEQAAADALIETAKEHATVVRTQRLAAEEAVTSELEEQARIQKLMADQAAKTFYGEEAMAAFGPRTYNNPAEQAAYEQSLRDSAIRETDRQIDYLTREIQRIQGSGATGGFARAADLQGQVSALRNRRNNINDYVFSPDYMDAAGLGRVGRRAADFADPGTTGRIEEQAKRQNITLEDIQRRLARLFPRT